VILHEAVIKGLFSGWVSRLAHSEEFCLVGSDVLFKNKEPEVMGVRIERGLLEIGVERGIERESIQELEMHTSLRGLK
jgi:hypothetical protein